ncbi:phosphatase PAP2 family protein [Actinoplanes sp. NPDC020271]|uniref:phosphatase PAP2 family protein n=1 Tax=Actinoplanes sp. NPDC020271 TaxID=3363896 RepID=UPI0037AADAEA
MNASGHSGHPRPAPVAEAGAKPATGGIARVWATGLARRGRRPGALVELAFLLVWLLLFTRLDAAVGKDFAAAAANARDLRAVEHTLHIDIELAANRWLSGNPVLDHLAVYVYRLYYAVIAGVLLWVFIRRPGVYRQVRRTMLAMTVLVLPVHRAVPVSPPRFALPGVVDIVARHDIVGPAARQNWIHPSHLTAMPSLHVGWSLWCAYAVWTALRGTCPRAALLSWLFPVLMAATVLTTGNHYVLDVAGSIVLLAGSVLAASIWGNVVRRFPFRQPDDASAGRA